MDISEDCWDHVGLLQEVPGAEQPPPPPAPDFLMHHQHEVSGPSQSLLLFLCKDVFGLFGWERRIDDDIKHPLGTWYQLREPLTQRSLSMNRSLDKKKE